MLSVIKSIAPVGVAAVESMQGHVISSGTYLAMGMIVLSNAISVYYDIEYHPLGYMWALLNCVFNVVYITLLRQVESDASNAEKTLHNNFLLCVFTVPLAAVSGEVPTFFAQFAATSARFKGMYAVSCSLAAAIGVAVFWVLKATSGSTLSFVGASNKVLVVILGAVVFKANITREGWCGIALALTASLCFTISKAQGVNTQPKVTESKSKLRVSLSVPGEAGEENDDKAVLLRRAGVASDREQL
jgi:drug/metabolite transporter (DMT)-like permease